MEDVDALTAEMTISNVTTASEDADSYSPEHLADQMPERIRFAKKKSQSMPAHTLAELSMEIASEAHIHSHRENIHGMENGCAMDDPDAQVGEFKGFESRDEFDDLDDLERLLNRKYEDEDKTRSRHKFDEERRPFSGNRSLSGVSWEGGADKSPDPYGRPAHVSDACAKGRYRAESGDMRIMIARANTSRSQRLERYIEEERAWREGKFNSQRQPEKESPKQETAASKKGLGRFLTAPPKRFTIFSVKSFKKGES